VKETIPSLQPALSTSSKRRQKRSSPVSDDKPDDYEVGYMLKMKCVCNNILVFILGELA